MTFNMEMADVWPPTERAFPFQLTMVVLQLSTLAYLFAKKKASKFAEKTNASKLERVTHGMRRMIEDTHDKDKKHEEEQAKPEPKTKKAKGAAVADAAKKSGPRTKNLPEQERVFGLLWDITYDQATTTLGVDPNDPNLPKCRELLKRVMAINFEKTLTYTRQAAKMEAADCDASMEYTKADGQKWLAEHDAKLNEVSEYATGDKLDEAIAFGEKVVEKLGVAALGDECTKLLADCKAQKKQLKAARGKALYMVLTIGSSVLPFWIFSVLAGCVGPMFHVELDKSLLSGRIANDAISKDGTWDAELSFRMAIELVVICVGWWVSQLFSDLLLMSAKRKFTMELKSKFMECLIFQDYEYFEKHGASTLQNRLNSDVVAVCENLLTLPKEFICLCGDILIKARPPRAAVPWHGAPPSCHSAMTRRAPLVPQCHGTVRLPRAAVP